MKIKTRLHLSIISCVALSVMIGVFISAAVQNVNGMSEEARAASVISKSIAELKIVAHEYLLHPGDRSMMQWRLRYNSLLKYLKGDVVEFDGSEEKILVRKINKNLRLFKAVFEDAVDRDPGGHESGKSHYGFSPRLQDRLLGELLVKSQTSVSLAFQLQQTIQKKLKTVQQKMVSAIIIILIILTSFSTIISLWINKSIAGPIIELEKAIQMAGNGILSHRVGVDANDEIGQLSRAFDKMTNELKETTVSKEYVENIIESMIDSLVVVTPEGAIRAVNRATCDLSGRRPEELIDQPVEKIFFEEETQKKSRGGGLREIIEKGSTKGVERVCLTKDGCRIPVLFSGSVMRGGDGGVEGVICLASDISVRKRAEKALRESEERYRTLFQGAVEGILIADLETRKFRYANPAISELLDYTEEDLKGMGVCDIHPKESLENVYSEFDAMKRGMKRLSQSIPCVRKDGATIYVDIRSTPIKIDGRDCNAGFFTDVTKRKRAEEALRQSYKNLKITQAQLVQSGKLASIGELASGVAHELNQPLMVVRSMAQLIRRNLREKKLDNDALMEQLEPIDRNTKRMMIIINHLRAFSRQSKGEFQPVDINRIMDDSLLMLGEQLRLRSIEVQKDLTSGLPKVKGDANQLEQVFLNLITNARDAIENSALNRDDPGIVKTGRKGMLEIITRSGNGYRASGPGIKNEKSDSTPPGVGNGFVEILIRDTGRGIPAQKIDKIFDPFFTTKAVGKGTGLGLSISYGIIQDHKGEIEVKKSGSEGTTFAIRLPFELKIEN